MESFKEKMEKNQKQSAVYIGEMKCGGKTLPLYNIMGGKLHGGTVTKETLIKMGIEVPEK